MSPLARGRFEALCGVVDFLATIKEPDDDRVWTRVTEKLAAALGCESAAYLVYHPKTAELAAGARRIPAGRGLRGWVAKFHEPLAVDDARADPRFVAEFDAPSAGPLLVVPLFDRLELAGAIELLDKRGGPFDDADLALAVAACRAAALTLRALRLESTVDKVTAHNASILENLGGGFVAIDAHGRLMLCNPAAKKMLGLPEDAALGRPIDESLAGIPDMGRILLDTLLRKETVKRQDLRWTRGGETRVLGYSTLLIQDPHGQVVGAGITFQDITQFQKK